MKRQSFVWCVLVLVGVAVLSVSVAQGATEQQKRDAIDKGLVWLAQNQQADGRWAYGGGGFNENDVAATGAALLSFLEDKDPVTHAYNYNVGQDVVINGTNYGKVLDKGINFIMANSRRAMGAHLAGNPDTNGNGVGVFWGSGEAVYASGLASVALSAARANGYVVTSGSETGRTLGAVIQDSVDYFAYAQADTNTGVYRGGWRYTAPSTSADNSTSQWPVVAMLYAQQAGATVPNFVKTELVNWVNYIQNPVSGGAGYDNPNSIVNESKTGGLLVELAFLGAPLGDSRVQAALNYINNNWQNTANSTWNGNFGHPYAMWSVYKGLQLYLGLDAVGNITNLHAPQPVDPPNVWNWHEDYSQYLVNSQNANGSWSGYSYWNNAMATAWDINILRGDPVPQEPIPEPATIVVWSLLAGAGFALYWRRKRAA
jgi:hypothetical protein